MHDAGAPQVRAAAAQRVLLAEALASSPRRHPGEVLLDCLHTADVLGQDALAEGAGGCGDGGAVERLVGATARAAALAKTALDAGLQEREVRLREEEGALIVAMLQRVEARMGLSPAQALLWRRVIPEELRATAAMADAAPVVTRAVTG